MTVFKLTKADKDIQSCIDSRRSFYLIAGAGSGKTTSLVTALEYLREIHSNRLKRDDQKIICITYTNRAVDVISSRLGWDDLYSVSTLHVFFWNVIKRFPSDIRDALATGVIPARIAKYKEADNGGNSKTVIKAREKIAELEESLELLPAVERFCYDDSIYSNYAEGLLGHDDVINTAIHLITENQRLRKLIGQKHPYILVDEAQDTFEGVVRALNMICETDGLPIVGYFGDPMQQIYDKRAGEFEGPPGSLAINKEENYRCSCDVIDILNAFRKDIKQFPAGENALVKGSVCIRLVRAENPGAPRGRYTLEQSVRASQRLQEALIAWDWDNRGDVKQLFLVRQVIARKLGFSDLQSLFTGQYASNKAQDEYERGDSYLLKPFTDYICDLVRAHSIGDQKNVIRILRIASPAFDPKGVNATRSLAEMRTSANEIIKGLLDIWDKATVGEVLNYCQEQQLCAISERLSEQLAREPRDEEYDESTHSIDKGDWLVDEVFRMSTSEIPSYSDFIHENTALSTQHGVKGEEYDNVLVVFDDVEAAWHQYSFTKTLTPQTSGEPTDRQLRLGQRLAYVCFSRARINLRVLLFTKNPESARQELLDQGLFNEQQIEIVG